LIAEPVPGIKCQADEMNMRYFHVSIMAQRILLMKVVNLV